MVATMESCEVDRETELGVCATAACDNAMEKNTNLGTRASFRGGIIKARPERSSQPYLRQGYLNFDASAVIDLGHRY